MHRRLWFDAVVVVEDDLETKTAMENPRPPRNSKRQTTKETISVRCDDLCEAERMMLLNWNKTKENRNDDK
jgi:hypothetical protein